MDKKLSKQAKKQSKYSNAKHMRLITQSTQLNSTQLNSTQLNISPLFFSSFPEVYIHSLSSFIHSSEAKSKKENEELIYLSA